MTKMTSKSVEPRPLQAINIKEQQVMYYDYTENEMQRHLISNEDDEEEEQEEDIVLGEN